MAETQRITAEAVETHILDVFDPSVAARSAVDRARSELLEKAVLANAEGWQSGPVEWRVSERGWDLAVVATVWMDMTRG